MSEFVKKTSKVLKTNIVGKERMREFQSATLAVLKDSLVNSFGPMGTNTTYIENNVIKYTKDGKTILENIMCNDIIEESVRKNLLSITLDTVKKVGDGTTSAVALSSIIFEGLKKVEGEGKKRPYQLIKELEQCVSKISEMILEHKQEFTAQTAYEIAYISTNGNEQIAQGLKEIYEEFGNDVFIDVAVSPTEDNMVKSYDGMTLEQGYSDTAYINNTAKGVCSLRNPEIYAFVDPIDTPEMACFLDSILQQNIYLPMNNRTKPVPTVILAPSISRDLSTFMENLIQILYSVKEDASKPPVLIVTNIYKEDLYEDIMKLAGCKAIRKYIDPKQQQVDIEKGLAPTPETIKNFAGSADVVESDLSNTKFVNPTKMHDENGELSHTYKAIVKFLKSELDRAIKNGEDNNVTGNLKRRLNSLNSNLVEFLIGGLTIADRDSVRDLVEDAVLNCRAAAANGIGFAANFEGFRASRELASRTDATDMEKMVYEAYKELLTTLYSTAYITEEAEQIVKELADKPVNIITGEPDAKILCSITTDVVILTAVSKIVSLMFTSNQFLCSSIGQNQYL